MKDKKVYCIDCKYISNWFGLSCAECRKKPFEETKRNMEWAGKGFTEIKKSKYFCDFRNKNNDCLYYEPSFFTRLKRKKDK